MAHLEGGNVLLDRRHVRRELSDEELSFLFDHVQHSGTVLHMPSPDREMLYRTAVFTGIRASELANLTVESFDLGETPTVVVPASVSKHRKEDILSIHPNLADRLRHWFAQKPHDLPLWPGNWAKYREGGKMLKHDLASTRAAWIAQAPIAGAKQQREESDFLKYRNQD